MPTPQIPKSYQDTPPYREYQEGGAQPSSEDSLVGRRVDMRLAEAEDPEEWLPGPDRTEPAKRQKQNDVKKRLQAKEALLEEEKKTSAGLRVELEEAKKYLQSRLDSRLQLRDNLQAENQLLKYANGLRRGVLTSPMYRQSSTCTWNNA